MTRLHYMDSMRAVLMMLGVVLHTAQIYNPDQSWVLYTTTDSSKVAKVFYESIHLFRMPAFFVISGFFCGLTLQRYGALKFLKVRIPRLVIPMVTTALTLNVLQFYVLSASGWSSDTWETFFLQGGWVSHLWFLANLTFYFFVTATVFSFVPKRVSSLANVFLDHAAKLSGLFFLLLLPTITLLIMSLGQLGFPLYSQFWNTISVYQLVLYVPFFTVGLLFGTKFQFLDKAIGLSATWLIALLVACQLSLQYLSDVGRLDAIFQLYFSTLAAWCAILVVFKSFHYFANRSSRSWQFLSDSAYTVYLFHHAMVIILGIIAIKLELAFWIGFPAIICIVLICTLAFHLFLIIPNRKLRFLFNGK
ncbi:acyltransferase family protein [Congregibacter litoralis]|uniref:Fucose 4-O-acetylase n=1 Tax=Congregibacter litoralis KT71 TaxID=314285 RepID=A4A545_9GAMM|nr:acyltransferase family protein [Congregibacter litoralis]EAQ98916.1 Fucose 4-O-acetylase [Congregibacter litoralis KT71]